MFRVSKLLERVLDVEVSCSEESSGGVISIELHGWFGIHTARADRHESRAGFRNLACNIPSLGIES